MNTSPHVHAARQGSVLKMQRCVLCGNKPGDVLFKGHPVCRTCLAHTKELS